METETWEWNWYYEGTEERLYYQEGEYSCMVSEGHWVGKQVSRGKIPGFSGGNFWDSYHSAESDGHSSWMEGGINRVCYNNGNNEQSSTTFATLIYSNSGA